MDPPPQNARFAKKNKTAKQPKAMTRRRLLDVRVGTTLLVQSVFALMTVVVRGMAAYFLQQNFVVVWELGELTARSDLVQTIKQHVACPCRYAGRRAAQAGWAGRPASDGFFKLLTVRLDAVHESFSSF